jgi:hypothetical protein
MRIENDSLSFKAVYLGFDGAYRLHLKGLKLSHVGNQQKQAASWANLAWSRGLSNILLRNIWISPNCTTLQPKKTVNLNTEPSSCKESVHKT